MAMETIWFESALLDGGWARNVRLSVEAGVIAESLGRTLTPSPFMGSSVLAASVLKAAGSETQKAPSFGSSVLVPAASPAVRMMADQPLTTAAPAAPA